MAKKATTQHEDGSIETVGLYEQMDGRSRRFYCEMCDEWFAVKGDCPACGMKLRTVQKETV